MQESNSLPSTPTDGDMIEEQTTHKKFKKAVKLKKINKVLSCKKKSILFTYYIQNKQM
jgi:hypothetical protein